MVACVTICQPASALAGETVQPEPQACRICELQANPQQLNAATVHLAVTHVRRDPAKLNEIINAHGEMLKDYRLPPGEAANAAGNRVLLRKIMAGTGVGSQLWRLLEGLGIKHTPTCPCLDWAERMNAWGPAGCRQQADVITAHMRRSARAYGWQSLTKAALKAAAKTTQWKLNPARPFRSLLDEAIRRAEAEVRQAFQPDTGQPEKPDVQEPAFDVEAHFRDLPYHQVRHNIAALACHFNPQRSANRVRCYETFARQFPRIGLDLFTIEGSANGDWEIPAGPRVFRYRLNDLLWSKENLLNVAFRRLPDQYEHVVWWDSDILVLHPDYRDLLAQCLDTHPAVQGFERLRYLSPTGGVERDWRRGLVAHNTADGTRSGSTTKGSPGGIWAARRDTLDRIGGLYERSVSGAGDVIWSCAVYGDEATAFLAQFWPPRFIDDAISYGRQVSPHIPTVGYVPSDAVHLYHGSRENRKYQARHQVMQDCGYDPAEHVTTDQDGLLRWSPSAPAQLRERCREYLLGRREDDPPAASLPPPAVRTKPKPVDVVYALGTGSKWQDNELRYSLRSLEKFCGNLGRVFIVGHKPDWVTGVIHIPHDDWKQGHPEYRKRRGDVGHKDGNIIRKVLAACKTDLSERFLFASDDQCFLAPIDAWTLPALHCGLLRPITKGNTWRRRVDHTRQYLESLGIAALHCDAHTITPHTKTEFVAACTAAAYDRGVGYTINTLTQNQNPKITLRHVGRSKLTLYKPLTAQQIRLLLTNKKHLGYGDGGLSRGLKTVLAEWFPHPSRFEMDMEKETLLRRGNTRSMLLEDELTTLLAFVKEIPPGGRFLEIGTYHGLTARRLAESRADVTVFSVDPLAKHNNAKWQSNRLPNMRLLLGTVEDLLAMGVEQQFDAALIDGDHHCGPCLVDLRACESLVKAGGRIVAHDYRAVPGSHVKGKPGVKLAVDEHCRKHGRAVDRIVGSLAVVR